MIRIYKKRLTDNKWNQEQVVNVNSHKIMNFVIETELNIDTSTTTLTID